jgi:hypothetical protein
VCALGFDVLAKNGEAFLGYAHLGRLPDCLIAGFSNMRAALHATPAWRMTASDFVRISRATS